MVKKLTLAAGLSVLAIIFLASLTAAETVKPQANLACAQIAVEKRDVAIISALDTYYAAAKQALTTRKDALKAAWGISDRTERRNAIKAAWQTFSVSHKAARQAFQTARKNAWKTFYADLKACKGINASDDSGGEGKDVNL